MYYITMHDASYKHYVIGPAENNGAVVHTSEMTKDIRAVDN